MYIVGIPKNILPCRKAQKFSLQKFASGENFHGLPLQILVVRWVTVVEHDHSFPPYIHVIYICIYNKV